MEVTKDANVGIPNKLLPVRVQLGQCPTTWSVSNNLANGELVSNLVNGVIINTPITINTYIVGAVSRSPARLKCSS